MIIITHLSGCTNISNLSVSCRASSGNQEDPPHREDTRVGSDGVSATEVLYYAVS